MFSLEWQRYKLFPYERELSLRELQSLFPNRPIDVTADRVTVDAPFSAKVHRLTYFARAVTSSRTYDLPQARMEQNGGRLAGKLRQATRYSVHGLHEYKGKFNPQIARALLNCMDLRGGDSVLDPFCGSGTTLVEAAHLGLSAIGFDINPLAVYVANAKLLACSTSATLRDRDGQC